MNHNGELTADRCPLLSALCSSKLFANTPEERGSELEIRSTQIKLPVERQRGRKYECKLCGILDELWNPSEPQLPPLSNRNRGGICSEWLRFGVYHCRTTSGG